MCFSYPASSCLTTSRSPSAPPSPFYQPGVLEPEDTPPPPASPPLPPSHPRPTPRVQVAAGGPDSDQVEGIFSAGWRPRLAPCQGFVFIPSCEPDVRVRRRGAGRDGNAMCGTCSHPSTVAKKENKERPGGAGRRWRSRTRRVKFPVDVSSGSSAAAAAADWLLALVPQPDGPTG